MQEVKSNPVWFRTSYGSTHATRTPYGCGINMYKYNEDKVLKELAEYIDATYDQHYSQSKYQAFVLSWNNEA